MRPYRKAGIASTFSPTHLAVLAEAFAFLRRVGAAAEVLHCSEFTQEKERLFQQSFDELGIEAQAVFLPGDDPCREIIQAVQVRELDLVIAGALERHMSHEERSFTGSVARRLLEQCPCDVLLLPNPQQSPPSLSCGFFAVEPGQENIENFVVEVSKLLGLEEVVLGVAETPFASALALSRGEEPVDTQNWADDLASKIARPGLTADALVVDSNTGFGLCEAVRGSGAQILVAEAARTGGRTVLPSHLDWMRQVIPTRLLLRVGQG